MTELPNIHPVDELQAVREDIKALEARADELRDLLLKDGASLTGDMYAAVIKPGKHESVDRKAITEAFGEKAVAPFIKTTVYKTIKIGEKGK